MQALRHDPGVMEYETSGGSPAPCNLSVAPSYGPSSSTGGICADLGHPASLDAAIPSLPHWVAASVFPRSYDIRLTYRRVFEDLNLWPQEDRELVVEFRIREGRRATNSVNNST